MMEDLKEYQIGDYVKVRNDLSVDCGYDGYLFVSDMQKYRGAIGMIRDKKSEYGRIFYRLSIDQSTHGGNGWKWTKSMLEDYSDPELEEIDESDLPVSYLLS